jgi:hypothetical protein
MKIKDESSESVLGYTPFKTALPKKKAQRKKMPRRLRRGEQYNPIPKDFGKMYNPLDENPTGVVESFRQFFCSR